MTSIRSSSFIFLDEGKMFFYCFKSIGYKLVSTSIMFFKKSRLFHEIAVFRKSVSVEISIICHKTKAYVSDCQAFLYSVYGHIFHAIDLKKESIFH